MSASLDYNTATPRECIAKSVLMHPSLLADRLRGVSLLAAADAEALGRYGAGLRALAAKRKAKTARHMAIALTLTGELDVLDLDDDEAALGFEAAADLLCLPPAVRQHIASRGL